MSFNRPAVMEVKAVRRAQEGFVIDFHKPHKLLKRAEEVSIPLRYSDAEHLYEMLDIHFGPKASRSQQQNSTDVGGPSRDATADEGDEDPVLVVVHHQPDKGTKRLYGFVNSIEKIDLYEEVAKVFLGQSHAGSAVDQKPMWVIDEALEFIRGIRPDVMRYGWTIELGGGVLQNGHSNSDLDLVFVSRSDVEPWPVHTILEKFFSDWTLTRNQSRISSKIVLNIHKVVRNNKSIDLIFVQGVSS